MSGVPIKCWKWPKMKTFLDFILERNVLSKKCPKWRCTTLGVSPRGQNFDLYTSGVPRKSWKWQKMKMCNGGAYFPFCFNLAVLWVRANFYFSGYKNLRANLGDKKNKLNWIWGSVERSWKCQKFADFCRQDFEIRQTCSDYIKTGTNAFLTRFCVV